MCPSGGSSSLTYVLTGLPWLLQVRTLPKVLKYLPSDKAQDARNFVNSLQYWLGGNAENLENLILTTAQVRRMFGKGRQGWLPGSAAAAVWRCRALRQACLTHSEQGNAGRFSVGVGSKAKGRY